MEREKQHLFKTNDMSHLKFKSMRLLLQETLADRCMRNPKYSLRAFAKFLEISPAALSAILNNKRPVTEKMHYRLGLKLGLSLEELKLMPKRSHGNRREKRTQFVETPLAPEQISLDIFNVISEPHHYALMELLKTADFHEESRWLAQRLNITVSEVNFAIQRLIRVGLLSRDENEKIFDTTSGFTTDLRDGLSSQAHRRVQIKSLQHAIKAVEEVPLEERDNTAVTLAIQSKDLSKARNMLKQFRRMFCIEMQASKPLDEVYQLSISFVPLTQKVKPNIRKTE